ncbi:RelA/SpoT family protein [Falsiroseomonas ponticola]|uniref:RelA/SpoT family protein n=1 Tax=Falsiroseomonas ponticola TaxID=2786951 RepID=UPI00193275E9|nr:bifunctional (p)ppGpp synthetase/guanosine-3',5'-bis(diphosphate) 3'-pyrophosphohydrolase [Roseomonas ponticola]
MNAPGHHPNFAPEGLASGISDATGADLAREVVGYDPRADAATIEAAYATARAAHEGQKRDNGDPYITHPVAVARILAQYRLDSASIVTALLHDVAEDTKVGLADLERRFGKEVARLVDGVTKLTRLELQSERTKQAENFRKLVLAMSEDIRVLLVKLADRLHNMRTLHFVPQEHRRRKTARETMDIFAPLAERIGMDALKTELETLSFRELDPDAFQTIAARRAFLYGQGADLIDEIRDDLTHVFREAGVAVEELTGREKSPYSIWLKMHGKKVEFEQLSDIMAFRVIVADKAACYAALGAVHSAYRVVPGRFKDYISTPKPNGYQSIHTGVTVPDKRNAKIEVQIRTREMHEVAEYGVAAHWIYKQGGQAARDSGKFPWVKALLDILEQAAEPQEFLDATRLELHRDQVFCFTPKGDLIALPRGSTCVDFAYQVHSQVGDQCVGAKINGQIKPLRTPLENGDQVEIITARGGTPNPQWERFVVTGKARARIRRFMHAEQRQAQQQEGRAAIAKAFRQEGVEFSEKHLDPALKALKQASFEELCIVVASGAVSPKDVVHAVYPELRGPPRPQDVLPIARSRPRAVPLPPPGKGNRRDVAMGVTGLVAGMQVNFAGCCHPLPGDRILGIVTTGKGVTVHKTDCPNLSGFADSPERFLDIDWDYAGGAGSGHVGRIDVITANDRGALSAVTDAIARQDGAIENMRIVHRGQDFQEIAIDVEVKDLRHLGNIIAALRGLTAVAQAERAKG